MYRRSKSVRPEAPKAPSRQRITSIARSIRVDEVGLLEAALVGTSEQDLLEQGKRSVPRKIVEDAFELYGQAWDFTKRSTDSAVALLRGCSKELLVLAARQALLLDDLLTRQETHAREYAEAKDKTRQRLQDAFNRAVKLRDQARRVLAKLGGTDEGLKAEINFAAMADDSEGAIQEALRRLSDFGRRLLNDEDPVRRQRVRLYGVDEAYLQMLDAIGAELSLTEQQFEKLAENESQADIKVHWCAGVNLILMGQVIEAFMAANDLDPSVPFLRPVHHDHLVRRLSMLPAPPPPQALAKAGKAVVVQPASTASLPKAKPIGGAVRAPADQQPLVKPPVQDRKLSKDDEAFFADGATFHGLLGKRR